MFEEELAKSGTIDSDESRIFINDRPKASIFTIESPAGKTYRAGLFCAWGKIIESFLKLVLDLADVGRAINPIGLVCD